MADTKNKSAPEVKSIKHQDTRKNIPTEELRDFMPEKNPANLLYPRDTSLDPQLVWKGKDEQDASDMEVPSLPIYIQEKIHPQALIDDLPKSIKNDDGQGVLFDDFNGLPEDFSQRVDFYRHEGHWQNRFILGDSLLIMNSLAEREGLKGQVQCIYFDPPYGIKFGSNWQVSTRKRGVQDGKTDGATRQPEQIKAFRDTWELGIHSYLAYLRDRLVLTRELLVESGSIFVQISDVNVHLVRCLLDEVYGSENFVSQINFMTTSGFATKTIATQGDYLLWYAKVKEIVKVRKLYQPQALVPGTGNARWLLFPDGTYRGVSKAETRGEAEIPKDVKFYNPGDLSSQGSSSEPQPFEYKGKKYQPPSNSHWKPNYPAGMKRIELSGRLHVAKNSLRYIRFMSDFPYSEIGNFWTDTMTGSFTDDKVYVVQTNTKVIERCLLMVTDPGDLVFDPTCGSGTTAYMAEHWGRRWITCDTSRVALALAKTRLMAAKYPQYILADSLDGHLKEQEITGQPRPEVPVNSDVRHGFVYKRAPHITLESIANNPDIHEGMSQAEIDVAIVRNAKTELLYDQPYEDKKVLRVSGPFTVESLSPHRHLPADTDFNGTVSEREAQRQQDFSAIIIDNLKKNGVQNTKKGERLKFFNLAPHPGHWINASGEYEEDGKLKRVAVSLGPEAGTVGPMQVKEAAKEAVKGLGFDLLLVCGFAFDPHIGEECKNYGSLTVLPTRMNPDLNMSDDLLKKTGAGNLFMIFGEPDIDILDTGSELVVTLKGLDIYDPTTGAVRSSSTDDIACWFIDTDYNGESFFVRHAYFTGADKPYERLKKALLAKIDEVAWSSIYSTKSRPFPKPQSGKIAIKIINHYGDEVLQVFPV